MADWLTSEQRSFNMASIRSTGNRTTEQLFLQLLRSNRITGWRRHVQLPGKPDFIFPALKIAIFVDGCFWHCCPKCYRLPEDNREYWREKVIRNRRRDRKVSRLLKQQGWVVLRFWEHELKTSSKRLRVLRTVVKALNHAPQIRTETRRAIELSTFSNAAGRSSPPAPPGAPAPGRLSPRR